MTPSTSWAGWVRIGHSVSLSVSRPLRVPKKRASMAIPVEGKATTKARLERAASRKYRVRATAMAIIGGCREAVIVHPIVIGSTRPEASRARAITTCSGYRRPAAFS